MKIEKIKIDNKTINFITEMDEGSEENNDLDEEYQEKKKKQEKEEKEDE
jgi:hypothetical protein